MSEILTGLLHPGEMGSAVGHAVRSAGFRVLWSSAGRTPKSIARASAAGLQDVGTIEDLVGRSRIILSVCPPHSALDVARQVAALGFSGLFVDLNAVSPATAREIGAIVTAGGASYVDGGIVGLPPIPAAHTRIYLSGERANEVAALFAGSLFDAIVLDAPVGAASALKLSYASWTKVSAAMLLAIRTFAIAEGVDAALMAEWAISQPELPGRAQVMLRNAPKAWRFTGEMEEIAAAFAVHGLPGGFALAARDVYQRLEGFKDHPPVSLSEVTTAVLDNSAVVAS